MEITNKQIIPAIVNLRQYSSTDTLDFWMDDFVYQGHDLSLLSCYAVTDKSGFVDKIKLITEIKDGKLHIIWKVTDYTTKEDGHIEYQIVFQSSEETALWYSYKAHLIVNSSIDADSYIGANYPSLLQQWEKRMGALDETVSEKSEEIASTSEEINKTAEELKAGVEQTQTNAEATQKALEAITQMEKNINELLGYEPVEAVDLEIMQARGDYSLLGERLDALQNSINLLMKKITVNNNGVKTETDVVFNITESLLDETVDVIQVSTNMAIRLIDPPAGFDGNDYDVSPYMGIAE